MADRPQLQQSKAPHAMHTFSDRNFALALARSVLKPRREDRPTSGRHSSYLSHLPPKKYNSGHRESRGPVVNYIKNTGPIQQRPTLLIDHKAHEVTLDGNPIHLTRAEFTLLTTFVYSPRQALSSHYLMQVLNDNGWLSGIYSLRMLVSRLRTKLGESENQYRRIVTVHGYGYRFEPEKAPDFAAAMASKSQLAPGDLPTSAFALVSLERNILWASDSFMHLLGWQPSKLIGTSLYELIHPDDKPGAMAGRNDLDNGMPAAFLFHLRNNSGQYRLVEALACPILDDCGHVICFLGEYRAATTVQKAKLALPNPIYIGRSESRNQE